MGIAGENSGDSQQRRQSRIMEMILAEGTLRVDTLASELNVSLVTIYRDLATLEGLNLLTRNRGEVSAVTSTLSEMTPSMRAQNNPLAKEAIAEVAAGLISSGNSVMIDDSSTAVPFVRRIARVLPLTVITNSQPVTEILGPVSGMTLIGTGGQFRRWGESYHGAITVSVIRSMHADVCVMSDAAISGLTVCNPYEYVVETKQAMLAAAEKRILLVDSSKFGRRALHTTAMIDAFDVVVVDSETPLDVQRRIRDTGVELLVAQI